MSRPKLIKRTQPQIDVKFIDLEIAALTEEEGSISRNEIYNYLNRKNKLAGGPTLDKGAVNLLVDWHIAVNILKPFGDHVKLGKLGAQLIYEVNYQCRARKNIKSHIFRFCM